MEGVNAGVNSIGPFEFEFVGVGEVEMGGGGELQPVVPAGKVTEKRKVRRPSKGKGPKLPIAKKIKQEEDDVCFICLNGGDLVLCDSRCCPKAYHLACIKRDESFFSSKNKWICGWHICNGCPKDAHYMCYTCTYSLCKTCIKDAEYVCVRENYGFCGTCLKIIMMIENQDAGIQETIQVDFDDPSSWEYLFKLYWNLSKKNLSLTLNELKQAQNPCGGVSGSDYMPRLSKDSAKDGVVLNLPKSHERSDLEIVRQASFSTESCDKSTIFDGFADWASRELLEFIANIKNGDNTTAMSRIDVHLLLLEYIRSNNLHDPNQKSQIICDEKLKNLFGKPFVGHVEMLDLLEYHFKKKEDIPKKKAQNRNNRSENRKNEEDRTPQTNFDDYAAIDVHNINLIFLRRTMIESLLDKTENFHDQVVGSIVRISVSDDGQKPDMHRLVQVVGTSKGAELYRVGNKSTNIMLEVLNLTKKESMSVEAISDQDFSEDECKRLRQSIKFGLMKRLAVEEIQMKANALQAIKFDNWLENEILRLNRIQDQAMEKGHIKKVKDCSDKLKILKTREERLKRLSEIPEVYADPKMNPSYESEDDDADEGFKLRNSMRIINAKKGGADKGEEPISDQRLPENRNEGGLNTSDKQEDRCTATGVSTVSKNQAMLKFSSESAMEDSPVNSIETNEIWRYRDPNGKIQGPFSFEQLRKWSGYFPVNMMIWNNDEQDDSILLTDALSGKYCKTSRLHHISMSVESKEDKNDVTDQSCDSNLLDIPNPNPNPNPKTVTGKLEIQSSENHESVVMKIRDMNSLISKDVWMSNPDDIQIAATEQNKPSEIQVEDSNRSRKPEKSEKTSMSSSSSSLTTPNSNQNMSCWQALKERIEFSTLGDESVSDLLAEIDAMEFRNDLLSSPMVDKNDCFSSIEDTGKSDALSSTADFPFPNLDSIMDDLFGNNSDAAADAFNPPPKWSGE